MQSLDSPPLVSLQSPKDVNIEQIEAELREIWQMYASGADGLAATRAATFSFIVYEADPTQNLLSALGFYSGPVDGIAGPRTTAAIKAAQKKYQLETTGVSNLELLKKLEADFAELQQGNQVHTSNSEAPQYFPDMEGSGIADAIAAINPCRIITLCPTTAEDEGVKAQVSAYCPINKSSSSNLICCEYITLTGTATAFERIGGMIGELLIADLPKFVWWKAEINPDYPLFKRLVQSCDRLIVDSSSFVNPQADLARIGRLLAQDCPIIDLNWARLAPWQELTAEGFDPPERREAIWEVDKVTIDYEKGNPSQGLMFLSWLATRLGWQPQEYSHDAGDYDIRQVKLITVDGKEINAELAGIPVADSGEVLGDLLSLRLSSTNLNADCCTVICSETTGCMRMEASGGAQACRIQQVTSLSDQNTEQLLGKQLQRWGKDSLYLETMKVAGQILDLMGS
jgi:glucose-6-phosphate dehydrogenase assembly protein OpcA